MLLVMLTVVILSVIMLSVITLNVVILSVVMLSVVAPMGMLNFKILYIVSLVLGLLVKKQNWRTDIRSAYLISILPKGQSAKCFSPKRREEIVPSFWEDFQKPSHQLLSSYFLGCVCLKWCLHRQENITCCRCHQRWRFEKMGGFLLKSHRSVKSLDPNGVCEWTLMYQPI